MPCVDTIPGSKMYLGAVRNRIYYKMFFVQCRADKKLKIDYHPLSFKTFASLHIFHSFTAVVKKSNKKNEFYVYNTNGVCINYVRFECAFPSIY